jgi:formamidopyrimidine-DNA glycosylase
VRSLARRGKYLVFRLDDGKKLIVHLRLSGHLEMVGGGERPRHERVRLELAGGGALSFVEPRSLGRAYLVEPAEEPPVLAGMRRLGPEPLGKGLTAGRLGRSLRSRTAAVKAMLLDQRVCCGVGNIYSDEALYRARVRPTRPAGRLTPAEVVRLARAVKSVLRDGIRWNGTTLRDRRYLQPDGAGGSFQSRLAVFSRHGEQCRRCGAVIRRIRLAGRATHYCAGCQK